MTQFYIALVVSILVGSAVSIGWRLFVNWLFTEVDRAAYKQMADALSRPKT